MLAKSELEKQVRERAQLERFGVQKPELFRRLVPSQPSVTFRCQINPGVGSLKLGDKLLIYSTAGGVIACQRQKKVGSLLPEAAADFVANFAVDQKTDVRIAEVISEPNAFDHTVDLALRPPWPN